MPQPLTAALPRPLAILALLVAAIAGAQPAGPLDIAADLDAGRAAVTASPWDIGGPGAMFDNAAGSLYRSASVNPAIVTITFTTPRTVREVALHLAGADSDLTLEAADSMTDLDAGTASHVLVLPTRRVPNETPSAFPVPETRRLVWRATVRRAFGDDFVHIRELGLVGTPDVIALATEPPSLVLDPGESRRLDLVGTGAAGERVIYDRGVTWSIPGGAGVATIDQAGLVTAVAPGNLTVVARAGTLRALTPLTINSGDITDLDVTHIARFPEYPYDAPKNRPAPGDTVEYVAHLRQRGGRTLDSVGFRWTVDGQSVAAGTLDDVAPGAERTATLARTWTGGRELIGFEIDPDNAIDETHEHNNALAVHSDAILVGFWVERTLYEYFEDFQRQLGVGSNSFENWAQRQIDWQNQLHAQAVWPTSPEGVLDRYAIQKIVLVDDGRLPLAGGLATNNPDLRDRTVDLMWGFPSILVTQPQNFYANTTLVSDANPFYREPSLLHELGHARYLIDHYGWDVANNAFRGGYDAVRITENGLPVAGTPLMPFVAFGEVLYYNQSGGIMTGPFGFRWSPYEAAALNLIAGERARCGNYNAPCNIGEFVNDLPDRSIVRFTDADGLPLAGADVRVYRADDGPQLYGKTFDDTPDLLLTAACDGSVDLGRNPWADGPIIHNPGRVNGVLVFRVEHDSGLWYRFWEVSHANLAFWAGDTATARFDIALDGAAGRLSPDLNGDDAADVLDILAFFERFGAADPRADLDRDGDRTILDILLFFEAFAAGC